MIQYIVPLIEKLNAYILRNSADSTGAFVDLSHRSSIQSIQDNFYDIQREAIDALPHAKPIQGDLFFDESLTDDGKWNRIYLKWYSRPTKLATTLFPKTLSVIESHKDIRLAMVSILEPGAIIKPHCGPWAGSIRVHVTLEAPSVPECSINVDGTRYHWVTGDIVAFNDTLPHCAENLTDQRRVILFLDVERQMKTPVWTFVVWFLNRTVARATSRD